MLRSLLDRASQGIAVLLLAPLALQAQVLDFEGLGHLEAVQGYYNGGLGSMGSGPGPNLGVIFSDNALVGSETAPTSNWANTPSGLNALFFLSGSGALMNVPGGFTTGFSFFYSSTTFGGSVNVFSGLNGAGLLLATLNLTPLGSCGAPDPFCIWAPIGVTFDGTAMSVDFGGTANQIGFDDITLRSAVPGGPGSVVPEPVTMILLGTGLAGVGAAARRRQRIAGDA